MGKGIFPEAIQINHIAMKKTNQLFILLLFLATGLAVYTGCTDSGAATIDPAVLAKHQAERVLSEQPADPVGIIELMTKLAGDSTNPKTVSSDPVEVALLGQVGTALADSLVFTDGEAAFTMVDPSYEPPTTDGDDHDHVEEGEQTEVAATTEAAKGGHKEDCPCPFCSSSKETPPQAIVTFVDNNGEPLPVGAKQLFGLAGEELVVVTGTAKLSVGQLLVTAEKIYVRK